MSMSINKIVSANFRLSTGLRTIQKTSRSRMELIANVPKAVKAATKAAKAVEAAKAAAESAKASPGGIIAIGLEKTLGTRLRTGSVVVMSRPATSSLNTAKAIANASLATDTPSSGVKTANAAAKTVATVTPLLISRLTVSHEAVSAATAEAAKPEESIRLPEEERALIIAALLKDLSRRLLGRSANSTPLSSSRPSSLFSSSDPTLRAGGPVLSRRVNINYLSNGAIFKIAKRTILMVATNRGVGQVVPTQAGKEKLLAEANSMRLHDVIEYGESPLKDRDFQILIGKQVLSPEEVDSSLRKAQAKLYLSDVNLQKKQPVSSAEKETMGALERVADQLIKARKSSSAQTTASQPASSSTEASPIQLVLRLGGSATAPTSTKVNTQGNINVNLNVGSSLIDTSDITRLKPASDVYVNPQNYLPDRRTKVRAGEAITADNFFSVMRSVKDASQNLTDMVKLLESGARLAFTNVDLTQYASSKFTQGASQNGFVEINKNGTHYKVAIDLPTLKDELAKLGCTIEECTTKQVGTFRATTVVVRKN